MPGFNYKIKQVLILTLLIAMILLSIRELYIFLPGLLGALTLYILSRGNYLQLVYHHKWKRGRAAGLFLLGYILILALIIYITVVLLGPKIEKFFDDPVLMINAANKAIADIQRDTGLIFFTESSLQDMVKKLTDFIPTLLNDTADLLLNLAVMLFILYYMLVHSKEMENYLEHIIPLKQRNIDELASETKRIVKASALGIPFISIIQGITALVGYLIFGVNEFILWGFITGVFAFFPVVGTMIIWVPLVIYMYSSGDTWNATGLMFYSFIVTGNVDYLARITILEKLGHVHPVVTVLGVIVGLGLFGFIGLIFGPLLVNYIILLFRIYSNEFLETNSSV
jgi:predicted PurR-regulated permease PerM